MTPKNGCGMVVVRPLCTGLPGEVKHEYMGDNSVVMSFVADD